PHTRSFPRLSHITPDPGYDIIGPTKILSGPRAIGKSAWILAQEVACGEAIVGTEIPGIFTIGGTAR
ncbi:hypothetical protein ASPCADRAFT_208592, partial [Aspergillus carbonarius ITEM 5010]